MSISNRLYELLAAIETHDQQQKYAARNTCAFWALAEALRCNLEAGVRFDEKEPEWPVVYIELPTGQVTWHVAPHEKPWDGHTTEEKYARVHALVEHLEAQEG